jgi:hypothetical protein
MKPADVLYMGTNFVPHHIVYLHKLAKLGKATVYGRDISTSKYLSSCCQFEVTSDVAKNWSGLADVERVTILYKPPDERRG